MSIKLFFSRVSGGKGRKGKERKGKERKGKIAEKKKKKKERRQGKERKGKIRKGKGRGEEEGGSCCIVRVQYTSYLRYVRPGNSVN